MRELLLDFYTNLGKRKLDQSKYIGTFDFKKGSTPKMELKKLKCRFVNGETWVGFGAQEIEEI